METQKIFDYTRFILLLKRTLILNKKSYLTGLAIYFGLIVLYIISNKHTMMPDHPGFNYLTGPIWFVWYILTLSYTSSSFKEMHNARQGYSYLMLPSSSFERFMAAMVITLPLFILVRFLTIPLLLLFLNPGHLFVGIIQSQFLLEFKLYFLAHSIFFLGASIFKTRQFGKTVLSVVSFFIVLALVVFFSYATFGGMEQLSYRISNEMIFLNYNILSGLKIAFYVFVPIALYVASYFAIKEKEL